LLWQGDSDLRADKQETARYAMVCTLILWVWRN